MKPFLVYTAMRIGLFLSCLAVVFGLWLLFFDTLHPLLIVVVAAVLSSVASWKLLAGPRERFAANVDARASRAAERFEEMRAKEDADEDAERPAKGSAKDA